MIKPYSAYKETGTAWLGSVPTSWGLSPLGAHFHERKGIVSDADFPPLSVTKSGIVPQLETAAKTDNGDSRKQVELDDFVINSRSDRKGSSGTSSLRGSVSVISIVLEPRDLNARFVHHLLRSEPFQEEFYRFGSGIVADLWSTRYSSMKQITLAVPSGQEQRQIADYLDAQTAKIDVLIGKQERLIETLAERRQAVISHAVTKGLNPTVSMKNSGVAWVGEIPSSWDLKRMKNLGSIKYGLGEPPEYVDDGVPLIRATNVSVGRITPEKMAFVNPADISARRIFWLREGDIIVVRSGALTGDSGLIGSDYVGSIAGFDMVFRSSGLAVSDFIQYTLLSKYVKSAQLDIARMRAAQPHLNAEELGNVIVITPSVTVQREIVDYLDHETAQIDVLSAKASEMIVVLKERRQALISAAVTGKIDVRGLS